MTSKFLDHEEFGEVAKDCIELKGVSNRSKGRYTKDHEPIKPVKAINKKEIEKVFAKTPSIVNLSWSIFSNSTC